VPSCGGTLSGLSGGDFRSFSSMPGEPWFSSSRYQINRGIRAGKTKTELNGNNSKVKPVARLRKPLSEKQHSEKTHRGILGKGMETLRDHVKFNLAQSFAADVTISVGARTLSSSQMKRPRCVIVLPALFLRLARIFVDRTPAYRSTAWLSRHTWSYFSRAAFPGRHWIARGVARINFSS